MVNKTFQIPLDLKKPTSSRQFSVVEGDNGNILEVTLTDNGTAVDLSGCKVLVLFSRPGGVSVQQDTDGHGVTIGGDGHNVITIDLYTSSVRAGYVTVELQIYSGPNQGTLVTTAQFNFECRRGIMNDDTIQAEEKYPILVGLIERVEALGEREQADWTEDDTESGTFIQNKPSEFTPSAHASSHAVGEADAITPAAIGALPYNAVPSNLIINGGFDIWQRGTSFDVTTNIYTADRWSLQFNGTGATRAITRQEFTVGQTDVPNNPTFYLRVNQSVAGSSGAYNFINTYIEDVSKLSDKTVTLSFYAKADSACNVATQVDQNFGSGGSPTVYVGDVTHALTTSWQLFTRTLTLPSVSGKTIGVNNFYSVYIILPVNTTFTIDIANVQLNYGSVALPFVPRSFAEELRLCQRYYLPDIARYSSGFIINGSAHLYVKCPTPVTMRTNPTLELVTADVAFLSNGQILNVVSINFNGLYQNGVSIDVTLSDNATNHLAGVLANTVVNADAEL